MAVIVHPNVHKDKEFVTAGHTAMQALDRTGLTGNDRECIGVFSGFNQDLQKKVVKWSVMEAKDTETGGYKTINGIEIRVMGVISSKW
jgi:hypothetical protein